MDTLRCASVERGEGARQSILFVWFISCHKPKKQDEPNKPASRSTLRNSRSQIQNIQVFLPLAPKRSLRTPLSRYSLGVWRGQGLVDRVALSRAQRGGISWLNVDTLVYR